ncbi:MAG: cytochrome C6 [Nostocales cyanobacterium]|nr:MAG: cytochrome C6 [Nostocales cyanobacterium]TAF18296.1 MAG: cytochrome C6 [Nostocales cyanobacterium]
MKKIISVLFLAITIFTFAFNNPALAADTATGKGIFTANCAQCHAGGKNLVAGPSKSLFKEALEANNMYSADAIVYQVTNGKNAMPAFKGRLNDGQIADVAAYVMEQADAGWK